MAPIMDGGRGMTPEQVASLTPAQIEFLFTPPKQILWREGEGERAKAWLQERRKNWVADKAAAREAKARHRRMMREAEERRGQ